MRISDWSSDVCSSDLESLTQVHLRAKRLGLTRLDLPVLAETGVEQIIAQLQAVQPALVVIDSIQTLYTDTLDSAPGSVSQLRECSAQLVRFAKSSQTAVVLVGHVPKDRKSTRLNSSH